MATGCVESPIAERVSIPVYWLIAMIFFSLQDKSIGAHLKEVAKTHAGDLFG